MRIRVHTGSNFLALVSDIYMLNILYVTRDMVDRFGVRWPICLLNETLDFRRPSLVEYSIGWLRDLPVSDLGFLYRILKCGRRFYSTMQCCSSFLDV